MMDTRNCTRGPGFDDCIADDYRKFQSFDNSIDNLTRIYGPRRDPLFVVIPITIIYVLIFVTGVIGNISTCIVISKNRSMHTATNYYLFSLAISDFLLLVSGVPQEVYSIWYKYPYVFGEIFCVARGLIAETSANATVLTITSFTVERYLAICHPFLQHTMSKLSRAIRLILVVWTISIFLAIPQALQFGVVNVNQIDYCVLKRVIIEHSFELSTVLFFFVPMSLITILYILIGLKLRNSGIIKHESGTPLQHRVHVNSRRQQANMGTRRVLKMLVAVVFAFFICWAPFHAQRLVAFHFQDQEFIYAIMTYISGILYYLSTCINPLLYNIMSNKFREAFKEILAKCFKQKRNDYTHSTYRILSTRQRRGNGYQESGDYSGSSIRDDCLCSTSTQKQSIHSMTLMQGQQHSETRFANQLNPKCSSSCVHISSNQMCIKTKCTAFNNHNCETCLNDFDSNLNSFRNIQNNVNCSNFMKPKNKSKIVRYVRNILRLRLHSRNTGYYSPRNKHSIDATNVHLSPMVATTTGDNFKTSSKCAVSNGHVEIAPKKDSIYMSSSDGGVPTDELTSYMQELRLRETR